MSFFSALRTSASALTAQRLRMEIISNNIANADTTRTPEGGAFRRQQIVLTPRVTGSSFFELIRGRHYGARESVFSDRGVRVAAILDDKSPTRMMFRPGHPDANPEGYVEYPNVNPVSEMVDMVSATRSYEASVTVINSAKNMALRALDIGRG